MNKVNLIQALKDSNHLSKTEAETVINLFFNKMAAALAQGERVEIRGLSSFFEKKYRSYTGRHPRTGEKVKISPRKLPFFKGARSSRSGWMVEIRNGRGRKFGLKTDGIFD
jgi:integration host factor subunit beta